MTYLSLRGISVFLAIIAPILITALNNHQPVLFSIIIPATPFAFIAVLSTPPDKIYWDKPYAKAGALLFANIGTLLIILGYNVFYYYRATHHTGGGADIGMGLVMMSMPVALLVGITIFAMVGEKLGSTFKQENHNLDEPLP